jgi:arylsulfatase A-like enzyme
MADAEGTKMKRPNLLLITTDTQRWDTLRCMGSDFAHSPNIDRLATEGVLFGNAHTPSPVCMPARCSLMTGVHAHVHGCIENGFRRFEHLPMLPDLLQEQGYTNIMVGKTHFGPLPASLNPEYVLHGEKNSDGDDFYAGIVRKKGFSRTTAHLEQNPVPADIFMDATLATTTMSEIERVVAQGKGPFFAFCSMVSPHGPVDPPGEWATLYEDADLPPLNYREGEIAEHPPALRRLLGYPDEPKLSKDAIDRLRRAYYGLASFCDHQVGRLMRFLDENGLREDTLVVFTSDHGQTHYAHGFSNKHNWYDESWRVPLVISQPGTLPEGRREGFAIWNDLTASLLAAAGGECPSMQGFDLYTPLLRGEELPRAGAAGVCYRSAAVVSERWKLEYYFEDACGRLFDRIEDPHEQRDLYHSAAHGSIRDGLATGLLAWYGDSLDLHGLAARIEGGGPIATRAVSQIRERRGIESEERLNAVCRWADAQGVSPVHGHPVEGTVD